MPSHLPYPLHLSGDLSLRSISELHATLTQAIATHEAVVVATDAVDSIDVAAMQLLVSATASAAARGRTLSLTAAPGGAVARTLVSAGFFAADGSCKVPTLPTWTITHEAA